jgi:hypothetical protein
MRRISRFGEVVFGVIGLWSTANAATQSPIPISDRWKLFVDRCLIERMDAGVELRLHEPTPQELFLMDIARRLGKSNCACTSRLRGRS